MSNQMPHWFPDYQQPFKKQYNVQCRSGHIHTSNMPVAGFVLVRLNRQSEIELLLDLRSVAVRHPNTWAFIGGEANSVNEEPIETAYREAKEEYGIDRDELNILGLQYKHDHGGVKYMTYTYIFAEYNGNAPPSKSTESMRSEWFELGNLPLNLIKYIEEDRQFLVHTLYAEVLPMLLEARNNGYSRPPDNTQQQANNPILISDNEDDGQDGKGDVQMREAGDGQDGESDVQMREAGDGQDGESDVQMRDAGEDGKVAYPKLPNPDQDPEPQGDNEMPDAPPLLPQATSSFLSKFLPAWRRAPTKSPANDSMQPATNPGSESIFATAIPATTDVGSGDSTRAQSQPKSANGSGTVGPTKAQPQPQPQPQRTTASGSNEALKPRLGSDRRVNKKKFIPKQKAVSRIFLTAPAPAPIRQRPALEFQEEYA
ncbi:hypothetical protein HD806DRAFT_38940 [Xylariaceae sp. AK1471]|nr:hypothetical protein HD806DRAFT_38940 [Xylariaceae sp. AK1471]